MAAFVYLPPATGKKKARTVDVGLLPIPPLFDSLFSSPRCREQSLFNGRWPSASFFRLRYASARVIAAVFLRDARRGKDCEFFTRSFNCILLHTLVYWGIGRDRFRFPLHLETGVDRSDRAPPRIYVRIIYFTC